MKTNQFYAVEATTEEGKKLLTWRDKKHFYFAEAKRGFRKPLPPTLFNTYTEAKYALNGVPKKGGNLKQFARVVECNKAKIVKVTVNY